MQNKAATTNLPLLGIKEIPTPKKSAKSITALVKKGGRITGYVLSDGKQLEKDQAIEHARKGSIRGVGIAYNRGNPYLKSLPDDSEGNNLSSLPTVIQD